MTMIVLRAPIVWLSKLEASPLFRRRKIAMHSCSPPSTRAKNAPSAEIVRPTASVPPRVPVRMPSRIRPRVRQAYISPQARVHFASIRPLSRAPCSLLWPSPTRPQSPRSAPPSPLSTASPFPCCLPALTWRSTQAALLPVMFPHLHRRTITTSATCSPHHPAPARPSPTAHFRRTRTSLPCSLHIHPQRRRLGPAPRPLAPPGASPDDAPSQPLWTIVSSSAAASRTRTRASTSRSRSRASDARCGTTPSRSWSSLPKKCRQLLLGRRRV